ncbi:hypothetical protein BGZ49_009981 [Haplosporangium sp. Z 27]|nr:hypothetical protein BGZ49_009981 [Haplosporangium sp. Z 27]
MTLDLRTFHFRIPDDARLIQPTPDQTMSDSMTNIIPKTDTDSWTCQLSILEDKSTLRATFGTLANFEPNSTKLKSCCCLQIMTAYDFEHDSAQVLLSKRVKSGHLFKRGIECNAYWTHNLAQSECDPIARNVDPLVEMMTQFERDSPTSDVEYRFVSKEGLVLDHMRAHQSILSIYPAFSKKLTLAQRNPHQRTSTTVLMVPIETWATFERILGFIYSGRLPREGFLPRSDQWRMAFELSREYGLESCTSSSSWMDWHLNELRQVITDDNVLELYFRWGYEHTVVTQMCVNHVAERSQVHFQGGDLGSHVMELLKSDYQGHQGCLKFQEALVVQSMKMYAKEQNKMSL